MDGMATFTAPSLFWLRLQQAAFSAGVVPTQAEVARKLGISRAAVNRWFAGTAVPTIDRATELGNWLGCSPWWLLSGHGGMDVQRNIDKRLLELLQIWDGLSEQEKARVLAATRLVVEAERQARKDDDKNQ